VRKKRRREREGEGGRGVRGGEVKKGVADVAGRLTGVWGRVGGEG